MKRLLNSLLLLSSFSIVFVNCTNNNTNDEPVFDTSNELNSTIIADTITYNVIIKNRDTADFWAESCMQYLKKEEFIDSIFTAVYEERSKAIDFFTGEELNAKALRKIESKDGFSRDAIGKIQFQEVWRYNNKLTAIDKQVLSMTFGIEAYSDEGEFRGYRPVFKVISNKH